MTFLHEKEESLNNKELILQKCESTNVAENTEINNLIDEMTLFDYSCQSGTAFL